MVGLVLWLRFVWGCNNAVRNENICDVLMWTDNFNSDFLNFLSLSVVILSLLGPVKLFWG